MKIGDLVTFKEREDLIGILTHREVHGENCELILCRVLFTSTNEAVWVFDTNLEGIQ